MADEKLIAPKHRRLAAFIADAILVFLLWYLMTMKDLEAWLIKPDICIYPGEDPDGQQNPNQQLLFE